MTAKTVMIVAGDPSGDANAADLVKALAPALPGAQFIGAGGPKMAGAGVKLSFDLMSNSAIGPTDALKNLGSFRSMLESLARLAQKRRPELVILVDSYSFTQPLAHRIRNMARSGDSSWQPQIVRYTSPQVWASRPGRAEKMARDIDLLLCLFPFEKDWYARRGTKLRVEFVGHPMFDRHGPVAEKAGPPDPIPTVVLLPGSRTDELKRHLPVMLEAARRIAATGPVRLKLVANDEKMAGLMRTIASGFQFPQSGETGLEIQINQLAGALIGATLAIACTGTVTMECAYFGVPTIALYKTNALFYLVARQVVTVKYLAMPNILADEPLFPEFIQGQATAENLARAALKLLADPSGREVVRNKLHRVIESLGGPGSTRRAAEKILQLPG